MEGFPSQMEGFPSPAEGIPNRILYKNHILFNALAANRKGSATAAPTRSELLSLVMRMRPF
jgi:hypothetical protein